MVASQFAGMRKMIQTYSNNIFATCNQQQIDQTELREKGPTSSSPTKVSGVGATSKPLPADWKIAKMQKQKTADLTPSRSSQRTFCFAALGNELIFVETCAALTLR